MTRRAAPPRIASDKPDDWRDEAVCRQTDPETWFPTGHSGPALIQEQLAKDLCHTCPSRLPCLKYALDHDIDDGVWGGLGELERRCAKRTAASHA